MDGFLFALTLASALGCGVIAGVFFAFSGFVMRALERLEPAQGVAAMQSINVTALKPPLMLALFGTASACLALGVFSVSGWDEPWAFHLLVGSALYLLGVILPTAARHVPLNNALAAVEPDSAGAATHWRTYTSRWTAWNHVRAGAAFAAAAMLTIALSSA